MIRAARKKGESSSAAGGNGCLGGKLSTDGFTSVSSPEKTFGNVRVLPPWDLLRGRCVFRDRVSRLKEVSEADLSHFAPNCATFSRAREIPIKGVANPPRPLRSSEFPEGIPEEVSRLSKKALKRLNNDTEMADLSACLCEEIDEQGKAFTLEHPGNSIALFLKSWIRLRRRSSVHTVFYHTCMFAGSKRKKYQVLITNRKCFVKRMTKLCNGGLCQRTGRKHLRWRPTVAGGRVVQFQTGDEREYPAGFCDEYAEASAEVLGESGTFVEVFSGPNAPLSMSMGRRFNAEVPGHALRKTGHGVLNEVQSLEHLGIDLSPLTEGTDRTAKPSSCRRVTCNPPPSRSTDHHTVRREGEESYNRKVTIQAAKQPGYGKRVQLIPDGLNDPRSHLERALRLEHPFSGETSLKKDHAESLSSMSKVSSLQVRNRLKTLAEWVTLAKSSDIHHLQQHHETFAGHCAKMLGRKPRTALMEALGQRYSIEDTSVPLLCLTGMPIVGRALESPSSTNTTFQRASPWPNSSRPLPPGGPLSLEGCG